MFGYAVLFARPTMKLEQLSNRDAAVAAGTIATATALEINPVANHLNTFNLLACP